MGKKIHPGWGAHSAVYALMMAKEGFTGPLKVFEGDFGLWKTHLGEINGLEEEISNLGKVWHTPQIAFKMYPVCHMTHSFIDCALRLQKEYDFTVEDIEKVECRIETRCYHIVCEPRNAKISPETDYMMRFSLPYVVAISLINGKMSPWEIDLKYAKNSKVKKLMNKIECIDDNTKRNPGYFPGWVKIVLKNGCTYTKEQRFELGTKENPININEVITKFNNNISPFYLKEQIDSISEKINKFERLENASKLIDSLYKK